VTSRERLLLAPWFTPDEPGEMTLACRARRLRGAIEVTQRVAIGAGDAKVMRALLQFDALQRRRNWPV